MEEVVVCPRPPQIPTLEGSSVRIRSRQRNVRMRGITVKEEVDLESISCLVDFAVRDVTTQTASGEDPMVRTFRASTPKTPAAAPRPDRPPMIASRRILPANIARPRPLMRSSPPSAALGAPPRRGNDDDRDSPMDEELPDIPDTPASPAVSDITVVRLVLFFLYCEF